MLVVTSTDSCFIATASCARYVVPSEFTTRGTFKNAEKVRKYSLLVIDEFGTISRKHWAYINYGLCEIMQCQDYWGGMNIIFVGDPGQLHPVADFPLISNLGENVRISTKTVI